MWNKLEELEREYMEIEASLAKPEILSNQELFQNLTRTYSELGEIVNIYRGYKEVEKEILELESLVDDPDIGSMAEEELRKLEEKKRKLEEDLTIKLLPKDYRDERNVILEIRAGTGGEEAALFAGDLLRMYLRYAERKGWKVEIMSSNPTDLGGYKEVTVSIQGKGVYSRLKFESGVHRVQRVPETEASGRIHTSTATVAILPEATEVEIDIRPEDLKIDTFRAGSAGGQHMQKNETAVRILHKPTGIVVTCQDERSQLQNREKAMRMLRTRLYDLQQQQMEAERTATRKSQVGTGDRSEKIRTYNFPQGRVTDHRIGLTIYNLQEILDGDIQPFVDALIAEDQARKLQQADMQDEMVVVK